MIETIPTRSRFHFALRTALLVVAATACALGTIVYHLRWLRKRQAIWAHTKQLPCSISCPGGIGSTVPPPFFLRLLGDRSYSDRIGVVFAVTDLTGCRPLSPDEEAELERIRWAFPESKVQGFTRDVPSFILQMSQNTLPK